MRAATNSRTPPIPAGLILIANINVSQAALEKKSHAVEGHKLAGKIKITKTMMNSHHNEANRKNVPVRKASNESTDLEEEEISEEMPVEVAETKSELDIDSI